MTDRYITYWYFSVQIIIYNIFKLYSYQIELKYYLNSDIILCLNNLRNYKIKQIMSFCTIFKHVHHLNI